MCVSLCACGGQSDEEKTTETQQDTQLTETEVSEHKITKLAPGETASTDIVDFTLLDAEFTIYASATTDSTYLKPTEKQTLYGASVGKVLMIPSFTMANKDRAGSINVCSGEWPFNWTVYYGDNEYPVYGFDLNSTNVKVEMDPGCIIDPVTRAFITKHGASNLLLSAGTETSMRIVTLVNFEPDDLGDAFDLKISLPTSSGELEEFIYVIPDEDAPMSETQMAKLYDDATQLIEKEEYYYAMTNLEQIKEYKDSAELYDYCIRRYSVRVGRWKQGKDFIDGNMDSFTPVKGDELNNMIAGKNWYVQGVGSNAWKFLDGGKIDDNWGNDRGWSIEGDLLVIRTNSKYNKLTLLKVYDGGYVLLENGEYYGTFYEVVE